MSTTWYQVYQGSPGTRAHLVQGAHLEPRERPALARWVTSISAAQKKSGTAHFCYVIAQRLLREEPVCSRILLWSANLLDRYDEWSDIKYFISAIAGVLLYPSTNTLIYTPHGVEVLQKNLNNQTASSPRLCDLQPVT